MPMFVLRKIAEPFGTTVCGFFLKKHLSKKRDEKKREEFKQKSENIPEESLAYINKKWN